MKKSIVLFSLVFVCCGVFAQDGSSTKITVFQPGGVKQEDVPKPPPKTNLIKWNYSVLTRGVFLMNYEIGLSEKITVEAGIGLTYRDMIYEAMKNESFLEYQSPNVNFAVEGAFRFYPKGHENFEGLYLSPGISFRKYTFDAQSGLYGSGYYSGYNSTFFPGYSFVDAQFRFGYQYESEWIDDITTDFYIGFGYRNVTAKYYEVYSTYSSSATLIRPITTTDAFPQPLFGFKLGMAF